MCLHIAHAPTPTYAQHPEVSIKTMLPIQLTLLSACACMHARTYARGLYTQKRGAYAESASRIYKYATETETHTITIVSTGSTLLDSLNSFLRLLVYMLKIQNTL
jgi:hypothetical protein